MRELIRRAVTSMDHVEVLMRLHTADGPLPERDIAATSRLPAGPVAKALGDLVAAGLVKADAASNTYLYSPDRAEDRPTVDELSQLYHQRPVTLVKMVYEMPAAPIRTFADAFRLRDDPKKP